MQTDAEFAKAYNDRKTAKAEKRRSNSNFDYNTAGGWYLPTKAQHDAAMQMTRTEVTDDQDFAARMVASGYTTGEKIHHDYIHIVNEWRRAQ